MEALPNVLYAYARLHPNHVIIKLDTANAFNSLAREAVLNTKHTYPPLAKLISLMYGANTSITFNDLHLTVEVGVNQGDPLAPLLYSTASKAATTATQTAHPAITMAGIADDKYIMGPPSEALLAVETYALELRKLGLTLQHSKSAVVHASSITGSVDSPSLQLTTRLCALHKLQLVTGFSAGGAPVGSVSYIQTALLEQMDNFKIHLQNVADVIHHQSNNSNNDSAKFRAAKIYRLIRWCLAPAMYNYTLRTTSTDHVAPHAVQYDNLVFNLAMDFLKLPRDHPLRNTSTPQGDLLKDRMHLHAGSGGLGFTSARQTADDARLGNLTLTASLVARILGNKFNAAVHGPTALPELYTLLNASSTTELKLPALVEVPPESIFMAPIHHLSAKLSHARTETRMLAVANRIESPDAKAWLLSCGGEGANYLMADQSTVAGPLLPNPLFIALTRTRVGLLPIPAAPHAPDYNGPALKCTRTGCSSDTGLIGLHPLHCRESGQGGLKGLRNLRHNAVKTAVQAGLNKAVGKKVMWGNLEPQLTAYWIDKMLDESTANPRDPTATTTTTAASTMASTTTSTTGTTAAAAILPGASPLTRGVEHTRPRGDLILFRNGQRVIYDVVITHPHCSHNSGAASTPGTAAAAAHSDKIKKYTDRFVIPEGEFEPIAVETGGRMHPRTHTALRACIKACLFDLDPTDSVPSDQVNKYNCALRVLLDSIAVSLARQVAKALIHAAPDVTRGKVGVPDGGFLSRGGCSPPPVPCGGA